MILMQAFCNTCSDFCMEKTPTVTKIEKIPAQEFFFDKAFNII